MVQRKGDLEQDRVEFVDVRFRIGIERKRPLNLAAQSGGKSHRSPQCSADLFNGAAQFRNALLRLGKFTGE